MAEIINAPTELSKVIPVSFKINDVNSVTTGKLQTGKQFNTSDTDAWLEFNLEGLSASGTYDLTLINLDEAPDNSIFKHTDLAFSGVPFHYKLDSSSNMETNEIRHAGRWLGQIVVRMENGDTTSRQFVFSIAGHILDGKVAQVVLLEDYNALIATITASKDLLTQYNIDYAALLADINTAEAAREQAEIDRAATFNALVDSEMIAQNVETKLTEKEATYAPRLLSAEQQLAETQADLQTGIGALTADAEVVTARNSTVKGKTFTVLDERLEEIENDAVILATNSVINGDFANGTTGWTTSSSVASIAANADKLTVNTTAQGNFGVFQNLVGAGIKYIAADFFNAEGMTLVNLGNNGVVVSIPGNTWKRASTLYTGEGLMRFYGQSKESLTYKMRKPVIINLTAIFGAGKEPTLAEMDRMMARYPNSWFDGTKPIQTSETLYQDILLKANKVQEAWITPTLVNSWVAFDTRTAKYKKADYGRVYLKGIVKNGTIGAPIFTLPTGYRPDEALTYAIPSNGVFGYVTVNTDGTVVCSAGSNVSVSLSGINFFV